MGCKNRIKISNYWKLLKIFLLTFALGTVEYNNIFGVVCLTSFYYLFESSSESVSVSCLSAFLSLFLTCSVHLRNPSLTYLCYCESLAHAQSVPFSTNRDSKLISPSFFRKILSLGAQCSRETGRGYSRIQICVTALKHVSLLKSLPFQSSKWQVRKMQFYAKQKIP